MYVISGSTHQRLGASLAEEMDAEFCGVVNRHFPDGERYIRILMDVDGQDVVVVQNTFPDKKIVELLLILLVWSHFLDLNLLQFPMVLQIYR